MIKNIKLIALIALCAMCSSNMLQAWACHCAVLHDPKTGHIVRLLGDRHANYKINGNEDEIEKKFKSNIQKHLDQNLKIPSSQEILILENNTKSMTYSKLSSRVHKLNVAIWTIGAALSINLFFNKVLKRNIGPVGNSFFMISAFLIIRKLFSKLTFINETNNLWVDLMTNSYNRFDNRITDYDLRNALHPAIKVDTYEGLFNSLQNHAVIESIKTAREIPLNYEYDKDFFTLIDKTYLKFDDKKISSLSSGSDVWNFTSSLSDYGFLSSIGRARKKNKNTTLYIGYVHSKRIALELQDFGYEVLYEKNNDPEVPLSKEECEQFFAVQPKKK